MIRFCSTFALDRASARECYCTIVQWLRMAATIPVLFELEVFVDGDTIFHSCSHVNVIIVTLGLGY